VVKGGAPLSAWIAGVGVRGPGLAGWPEARAVLAGEAPYRHRDTELPAPTLLPAAERRRTGRAVKLALAIGIEAIADAGLDARHLPTVFTSSGGDGENCHLICETLASEDRQISPTRFHNSVHNTPAGYWSIATGAMAPSSCLCAYDASFAAGLLEALAQVVVERAPVALLAYDTGYPEPLLAKRPIREAFGLALVLTPERPAHGWRLSATLDDAPPATLADARLEALRQSVPAARALPLLQALASGGARRTTLAAFDEATLSVEVSPC
jgi:hypothetical protein